MLPAPFEQQMQDLLGAAYPEFTKALQTVAPVSIRLNPAKTGSALEALPFSGNAMVPWHPQGYYLPERPVFTLDPALHAGAYYVQEASSMFLYQALSQTVDFSKRLKVLDLCAAPGGKSTLIGAMLGTDSLLVANEVIKNRCAILRENLERWGLPNVAVTSTAPEAFDALEGFFDLVVVDAPCSGEGLFRKDPRAIAEWSPAHVSFCAGRQRHILAAAVDTLAPGGILVYSTCTYNRLENENNTTWLTQTFPLEARALSVDPAWGLEGDENGYHFFPHRAKGEGFFIAVFEKQGAPGFGNVPPATFKHLSPPIETQNPKLKTQNSKLKTQNATPGAFKHLKPLSKALLPMLQAWIDAAQALRFFELPSGEILALPASLENDYLILDKALHTKWFGVHIGSLKGKDFIPSHALALSTIAAPGLPSLELDLEQALRFLKKETFDPPADTAKGWTLASYKGFKLGWMKLLPNRMNNYLPPERRIRMNYE